MKKSRGIGLRTGPIKITKASGAEILRSLSVSKTQLRIARRVIGMVGSSSVVQSVGNVKVGKTLRGGAIKTGLSTTTRQAARLKPGKTLKEHATKKRLAKRHK